MKEAPDWLQSGASSLWKMPSCGLTGARCGVRAGGWGRKGGGNLRAELGRALAALGTAPTKNAIAKLED